MAAMKAAIEANRRRRQRGGGRGWSRWRRALCSATNEGKANGDGDGDASAAAKGKDKKVKASKGKKGKDADASKAKQIVSEYYEGVLKASDDMPFFQKSGLAAATRKNMAKDVKIGGIRMCAGKQELLDSAVLALNYGVKYGLVGRNGVGKTTLLRQLSEGIIALPKFSTWSTSSRR